jgi:hypothetical protein
MIEILKVQEIVREAAKIFSNRNAAEQIKQKGVFDYVTAIDEAVQEFIQKELSDLYPQIQFMGEEKDNSDIDMSGQVWVLDPVDGTTNLIHDYQNSAISLALIDNSEIILGIIYNPFSDEMFYAEKDKGSFLNGKRIYVSDAEQIVIKDNDDTHVYTIPESTIIPANGFLVIDENTLGFGFGKGDSVRLYEGDMLIGSTTWSEHTNPTWGLYPDVNGTEYRNTKEETPGAINKFDGVPEIINWPGKEETVIYDQNSTFLEDSSGLDFYNGQLYAVDNGTGKFWILDVAEDGTMTFAKDFENGKRVRFQKDAENPTAAGPDAEGISVDGNGMVYLASERDNSVKGVNYNTILMVNPNAEGDDLIALMEWNLTDSLPQVSANMGIESVEWISSVNVNGKLFDQNTNAAFDIANYPKATANGVFFVALEDNGHVYAYVLNDDGTCVQITDIDSKIGGAMALDYDTYENVLWVVSDNGYNNRAAKIAFNGTADVDVVHVNAPSGVDVTANNEGFAIAEYTYTNDGQRPVYRFLDGVTSGALSVGNLACDYVVEDDTSNDTTEDEKDDTSDDMIEDGEEDGSDDMTEDEKGEVSDDTTEDEKANASNDKKDNDKETTESPKTGDTANVWGYLICAGASIIVILEITF